MTREMQLTEELRRLREQFSLCDTSEENIRRGERIREIRKELDLVCEPRKNKRSPKVQNR